MIIKPIGLIRFCWRTSPSDAWNSKWCVFTERGLLDLQFAIRFLALQEFVKWLITTCGSKSELPDRNESSCDLACSAFSNALQSSEFLDSLTLFLNSIKILSKTVRSTLFGIKERVSYLHRKFSRNRERERFLL